MLATHTQLRRAVVHRHTHAGRAFWAAVADLLDVADPSSVGVLAALFREASNPHATLATWWRASGGGDPPDLVGVREALQRVAPPVSAESRRSVNRAKGAVGRAIASGLQRSSAGVSSGR